MPNILDHCDVVYWSGVVTLFPRVKDLWCLGMLIQTRHARLVTFVFGLDLIMMAILSYCQGSEFSDYSDFLLLHVTVYPGSQTSILTISNQNSNEKFSLQLALMPTDCRAVCLVRGVDMWTFCEMLIWNNFAKFPISNAAPANRQVDDKVI